MAIGGGGKVAKLGRPFGQGGQHGVAVRNGFISWHLDAAGERFGRMNRLSTHASNFSTRDLTSAAASTCTAGQFANCHRNTTAMKHGTIVLRIIDVRD